MSKQFTNSQSELQAGKPEDVASAHELTDEDLEQVAGGLSFESSVRRKGIGVGELHNEKLFEIQPASPTSRGSE